MRTSKISLPRQKTVAKSTRDRSKTCEHTNSKFRTERYERKTAYLGRPFSPSTLFERGLEISRTFLFTLSALNVLRYKIMFYEFLRICSRQRGSPIHSEYLKFRGEVDRSKLQQPRGSRAEESPRIANFLWLETPLHRFRLLASWKRPRTAASFA